MICINHLDVDYTEYVKHFKKVQYFHFYKEVEKGVDIK